MRGNALVKHIEGPGTGAVAVLPTAQVLALRQRDPWAEAKESARGTALQREVIVNYLRQHMDAGVSLGNAVALLLTQADAQAQGAQSLLLPAHVIKALYSTAKAKRLAPSRSTICEWVSLYQQGGLVALLPQHKGRVVQAASWMGPALEFYNQPSKPDMAAVHRRLVEVEGFAVTYDQVRGYLASVPAMFGRNSPARLGKNLYRLTEKAYIRRSTEHALPGDVYVADGYRADVYIAHPITGDVWRPELTVLLDMRSRACVHWSAYEHEGAYAVQNTFAEAFSRWNHVPPFLYLDNGSGYKNMLMSDEATGFYARAGVQQIIHAIPGNPHGKGWVERFFRIVKDDFLRLWMPQFYCGDEMADEVRNRIVREVKAGRLRPPSLAEFAEAFNAWLVRYHSRPHPEDKTVTRGALWAQLAPLPPAASVMELKRPAVKLKVRRAHLKHGPREYGHPDLLAFNGVELMLEYDLLDDAVAVVRTLDGRWVCDAHLIKAVDAVAPNRLEEKRQARAADAIKRLEKKMEEQRARAGHVLDLDAVADAAALPAADPAPMLPAPGLDGQDGDDLNLLDF